MSRRRTLRTPQDLLDAGLISDARAVDEVARAYAVALTPAVADLIDPADPHDPIARQYVPSAEELVTTAEERADPIGDAAYSPVKGLVHRYPDRVLLTPLLVCPVYCRFCFRRARVGDAEATMTEAEMDSALAYVAERPQIREVILTGGDPLMLGETRLGALLARIRAIPHVDLIRIHSRVPVSDPKRITAALARLLGDGEKPVWLAVHVNHARELSPAACAGLGLLARAGVPLLSQTVLLKGVNDTVETLEELFRALVRNRVRPYYLHHPDLAPGTGHFRPTIAKGQALMRTLRGRLSGIAQPTYVLDIPGGAGKVPVGPGYWDGEGATVTDPQGGEHPYLPG
ncbi:lysine 2,3-aminomutase [Magnetospirillum sp. ME-1]|uniref:lysine-2,3-aminomutase-like protein n=1 Tax=Magnetospirillum sp. ME-1 TaxID=1639348 RepID=UPI000A17DA6F|nr:lysine-2,3-aminomutase-like protein [Magnetospirillum sp. ME-1]ARJ67296.1 lysine 2,3-aminomutase [Magnetospirillum sp. ME-1]